MRFAFADPPYLGCGARYKEHHDEALAWDDPETHRALVQRLVAEYPDGWLLCLSSPSLHTILPMVPADCRVGAWVKPFCAFKANVTTAYAWEPVIFSGGRKRAREVETVRDWVSSVITLKKGLTGAKPEAFCEWVLDLLNVAEREDVVDDLFPGTGIFGRVMNRRAKAKQQSLPFAPLPKIAHDGVELQDEGGAKSARSVPEGQTRSPKHISGTSLSD